MFDSSGNAVALLYPDRTKGVWYMYSGYGAWFVTNWTGSGGYNRDLNAGFQLVYDDVDSIDIAPEPGGYFHYFPKDESLRDDVVGIFWLDAGPDSLIGEGDHFGKFLVLDYNANDSGYPSAIRDIYYQAEPMLRWLVTR